MDERYLVVKSSTGVMKVVALGPKLAKKKVCKGVPDVQPPNLDTSQAHDYPIGLYNASGCKEVIQYLA